MMDLDHTLRTGLAGSRWATQSHTTPSTPRLYSNDSRPTRSYNTSPARKPTSGFGADWDWDCTICGFDNFGFRKECMRCLKPKDGASADAVNDRSIGLKSRYASSGLDTPNTIRDDAAKGEKRDTQVTGALSMSRWAPRNRAASQKYGDRTWTRIAPVAGPSTSTSSSTPSLDLGLPYEVQHYILSLLQTLLEEACFSIASRWLPSQLSSKNWTCSEAVELSVWREFLPTNLPSSALHSSDVTLEQALQDAVRIRNKAVHRHLVDNSELRNLCWKGERLMVLLGDVSRREKCIRLRDELERWDRENAGDMDAKKRVLEQALVVIGEKPVADMDWTPNEVSMAEVKEDEGRQENVRYNGTYADTYASVYKEEDAMELD